MGVITVLLHKRERNNIKWVIYRRHNQPLNHFLHSVLSEVRIADFVEKVVRCDELVRDGLSQRRIVDFFRNCLTL